MTQVRAFRCWIVGAEDLGCGIIGATSADEARAATARSAHECGYVNRANPGLIRCRRAPEYDGIPEALTGKSFGPEYLDQILLSRTPQEAAP